MAQIVRSVALVGLALAVAGCAGSPSMRGMKAERTVATEQAVQVLVTLELVNPNDAPIELTEWEYSASIGGKTVYSGTWVAALTLPAGVPMQATLPVVVSGVSEAELATARWSVGGSVGYRATRQIDRLLYQLGINRLSAGFDVRGEGIPAAPPPPPPPTNQRGPGQPPSGPPAPPPPSR